MPADTAALDTIVQELLPLGALDADGPMYATDWNALVRAVALLAIQLGATPVEFPAPGSVPHPPPPADPGRTLLARLDDLDERMARLAQSLGEAPAGTGDDDEMSDIVSDARLDAIEAESAALTKSLDGLASKLDARLRALEDRFEKHVQTVEEELARLGKGLERLAAETKGFASEDAVEKRLVAIESSLLKLSGQINTGGGGTTSPDIGIFKDRLDLFERTFEGRFSKADAVMANATTDIANMKAEVVGVKSSVSAALDAANTANASATSVSSKFTDLQKTVNLSTTSLESLKSSLTSATSRIGTVESKVSTVESKVSTVETKITTVEADVTSIKSLDLTTRLKSLETETTTITKSLALSGTTISR